jgi:hypothetical protein
LFLASGCPYPFEDVMRAQHAALCLTARSSANALAGKTQNSPFVAENAVSQELENIDLRRSVLNVNDSSF